MRWLNSILGIFALASQAAGQPAATGVVQRVEIKVAERVVEVKLSETRLAYLLGGGDVVILGLPKGDHLHTIRRDGLPTTTIAISRDGEWLAMGGPRETIPAPAPLIRDYTRPALTFGTDAEPSGLIRPGQTLTVRVVPTEVMTRHQSYGTPGRSPTRNGEEDPSPLGGTVSVRRVRDGGEVRRRSDFSDAIVALSLDDSRLTVIQEGLEFVVLDDKMKAISAYRASVSRLPAVYPHSGFAFADKDRLIASLVDGDNGVIQLSLFDSVNWTFHAVNRDAKNAPPWAIALSPDGRHLAACGPNESLRVWDVVRGGPARKLLDARSKPADLKYVAFGETSDELVTYGNDDMLRIWNVASGEVTYSTRLLNRNVRVASLREGFLTFISGAYHFSSNGRLEPLVIESIQVRPNVASP